MLRAASSRVLAKSVLVDNPKKRIIEIEVETMGIDRSIKKRTEGSTGGGVIPHHRQVLKKRKMV